MHLLRFPENRKGVHCRINCFHCAWESCNLFILALSDFQSLNDLSHPCKFSYVVEQIIDTVDQLHPLEQFLGFSGFKAGMNLSCNTARCVAGGGWGVLYVQKCWIGLNEGHQNARVSVGGAAADSVAAALPLYVKSTHQHTPSFIFVLVVSFLWEVNQ